jgi:hypothetical protein
MARSIPTSDSLPWYRQFWPWFLIALPASVVVAGFSMLYIANRHADDLGADDSYKQGLTINRQLAKQEQARARDISARVNVGDSELTVTTTGAVTDPSLRLRLSHPMEADRDFYLTLGRRTDGIYSAPLPTVIGPHWHWTLDTGENSDWRLDGSLSQRDINRAGDG